MGPLDQVKPSLTDWYVKYREYWERVTKEAEKKKVK